MQKSKKRILGAAGLATVAGMTVVAHNIQTPEAYAWNVSSDTELNVVVASNKPNVDIEGPLQNNGATSQEIVTIPINVTDVKTLSYTVVASQEGVTGTVEIDSDSIPLAGGSGEGYTGIYSLALNLQNYKNTLVSNYGYNSTKGIRLALSVKGVSASGGSLSDSIAFTYAAVTIDPNININPNAPDDETNVPTAENGDPVITVETGDNVETIHVIVRDPISGEIIWEGDFPAGTDVSKITLPFAQNGIGSGNYIIEIKAYDADGNLVGDSSLELRYIQPDGLGLPNTGGVSIAGLNIAKADFLLSGALIFFLVSAGGIYLIHRKQTRK